MEQPQESIFDKCNRLAAIENEQIASRKPITGWGSNCLLGKRPTEDGAVNYHKTGIIWGKGGYLTGHYDKRLGEVNGMIVLWLDESRQPTKLDEWIIGRLCRDCGQRKPLNGRHFHLNPCGKHGYHSICSSCRNRTRRNNYANNRHDDVRKYRRN